MARTVKQVAERVGLPARTVRYYDRIGLVSPLPPLRRGRQGPTRHLGRGAAGFTEIRAKARVKAPGATEAELKELCTYVQDTSPVKDVLARPVPVKTTIELL